MNTALVILSTLGALLSTAAAAQSDKSNFQGPRIEARVGWDRPVLRATISDGTDRITRSEGANGIGYGGEIGYDANVRGFVVGGYAGIDGSSTKSCGELYGNDRLCVRAGRSVTAGVRLGIATSSSFLVYAKGGYSNGRISVDYRDFDLVSADEKTGDSLSGFHVGSGIEGTLNGGVYGRLEYVYTNYSARSETIEGFRASLNPYRHQVIYGLGYRF